MSCPGRIVVNDGLVGLAPGIHGYLDAAYGGLVASSGATATNVHAGLVWNGLQVAKNIS